MDDDTRGTETDPANRDRAAVASLACSLSVVPLTALLIPVLNMPSTSNSAGYILVSLLIAGAVLWVSGLVLSLRAIGRTRRHHRLAKAGMIVSITTPMLFLALLLVLFLQALDWYFNDFFTIGEAPAGH